MATLKITQTRSVIRQTDRQKKTIQALGLGRPGQSVTVEESPQVNGMIQQVAHLLKIETA